VVCSRYVIVNILHKVDKRIIIIIIIIIMLSSSSLFLLLLSLITSPFFPVLLLNQQRFPPLRLEISDCNAFRILYDVTGIAVLHSESTGCFPDMASKFYFYIYYYYHHHPENSVVTEENHTLCRPSFEPRNS